MLDTHFNTDVKPVLAPAIRAYLGGSFDPVHNGHLQMALYVYESLLQIAKQQQRELHVSLLPNARSPFKQNSTDPEHRLAMLKLAIKDTALQINELELWQTPPVYTIDSVQTLRSRYPHDSLIFIMGMDSARSLDKWKDGLHLTDYVNLWIFDRIDTENITDQAMVDLLAQLPAALQPLIVNASIELIPTLYHSSKNSESLENDQHLQNTPQGRIYIDTRTVSAISSTNIRRELPKLLQNADYHDNNPHFPAKYLDSRVYKYIIAHQLYYAAQFR